MALVKNKFKFAAILNRTILTNIYLSKNLLLKRSLMAFFATFATENTPKKTYLVSQDATINFVGAAWQITSKHKLKMAVSRK